MRILDFLIIASALFQAFLVVAVFLKNPRKKVNQSFALFGGLLAIWSLSLFFYDNPIVGTVQFWIKFVYSIGIITVYSAFYFTYIFPIKTTSISKLVPFFHIVASIIFLYLILFTNLFVKSTEIRSQGSYTKTGIAYYFYAIWIFLVVFQIIYRIHLKENELKGIEKVQLKFMKYGFIIFSFWTFIPDFILPIFFDYPYLFGLSSIGTGIFSLFTAYSIVKYRFFNMNYILGKFIYYLVMAAIPFTLFYAIFLVQTKLWGGIFEPPALFFGVFIAFAYIFIFWKLDEIIRKFLEKKIIYLEYDPVETIKEIQDIINSEKDLEKVVTYVLTLIKQSLNCERIGLVLFDKNKVLYRNLIGFSPEIVGNISKFEYEDKLLVYDEAITQGKLKGLRKILNLMKKEEMAILLPFH